MAKRAGTRDRGGARDGGGKAEPLVACGGSRVGYGSALTHRALSKEPMLRIPAGTSACAGNGSHACEVHFETPCMFGHDWTRKFHDFRSNLVDKFITVKSFQGGSNDNL